MPYKICNDELKARKAVQNNTEKPRKYAKTQKIRPSEEGRIFQMVGVSGFEPDTTTSKPVENQGLLNFITFFHYIFAHNCACGDVLHRHAKI